MEQDCARLSGVADPRAQMWNAIYHGILTWAKVRRSPTTGIKTTGIKRVQVTVETDQVLIIRRRRSIRGWCSCCGREVDVAEVGEAETLTRMRQTMLADPHRPRSWHLLHGGDGKTPVCLESILNSQ